MGDEFEIKDLGNLKIFLGMKVAKSKEGISVSQRKYTIDLLTKTSMLGCCPTDTPIEFNCKLGNSSDKVPIDKEKYQHLMKKLIYLSHTRPDISYVVSAVSQFMKTNKRAIEAYTDSDWDCEVPMKLFSDNKATISIANNPVQHDRTKHVEIDKHFIKEILDNGSICIPYIPSSQQVADVPTKRHLRPSFDSHVSKLSLIDIYVST
ncbi:putative mitochondrial protein [Cucumis melo var. makuwa]|uniref:Putative mitochondrial protein n=1 Tax=Cucumis melo var. makuwa TaxID=1194695 RepID=A0A5D3BQC6_CUCMM|nr:putative mitochondrial protein [Cucumis melo var. makuwa]